MAKAAKTSITREQAQNHKSKAKERAELACKKIIGFHLQKTKNNATWRFRYADITGKRRLINLGKFIDGTADRLEAAEKAIAHRASVDAGNDPIAENKKKLETKRVEFVKKQSNTLGAYLEGGYKTYQSRKRDNGIHNLNIIKSNFKDWLDIPMSEISVSMLEQWQAEKEAEKKAYSTIQRAFGALRSMIKHAVRKEVLDVEPFKNFKLEAPDSDEQDKKLDGTDRQKRRMLTPEELAKLRDGAEKFKNECLQKLERKDWNNPVPYWFYIFYRLAAYSGLRPSDLYTLNWQELNLTFKRLTKTPQKTRHHPDPIEVNIGLDKEIIELLNEWHSLNGKPTSGLVFVNPKTGKRYGKETHNNDSNWKRLLRLSEISEPLDFYSLRHHFISKMVASGVDIFTVARLAGHKDLKMIQKHYAHLAPDNSERAIAMVASDFSTQDQPSSKEASA